MNKKLIITEEQYKNLKMFLLESTFDVMANKVIKKDDVVTITSNGKKFNFNVISNNNGEIYMVNTDDGTKVYLTKDSFKDNKLTINVAQDEKQKKENPPRGLTWPKMSLQNIEQIDVFRDGKQIEGTDYDPEKEKEKSKFEEKRLQFISLLEDIDDGDTLILDLGNITIELIYIKSVKNMLQFKLTEDSKKAIRNENIISVLIELNEDEITVDEKGLINLKLQENYEENGRVISKFNNVKVYETEIGTKPEEKENEEDKIDSELFVKMLANDEQLKAAYYQNPSPWKSFWSALKGEEPKTTGFQTIQKILHTYIDKKVDEKIGENFLRKGIISFQPMENIEVLYSDGGKNQYFTLSRGKVYRDDYSVKRIGMDDETDDEGFDYNLRLENRPYGFEIIVKEKTEEPNVFICDVRKVYKVKSKENRKGVTKRSEPVEDVEIRFLESTGYKTEKVEKK